MAIAGVTALGTACNYVTDVEVMDVVGSWNAVAARYAVTNNLNDTADLIDFGWNVTMDIQADATLTLLMTAPGETPVPINGTLVIDDGNDITVGSATGEIFREGTQLAMYFYEGIVFEVDGKTRPVTLLLVMERK